MDRYIWGERNGIHIFDLQQTLSGVGESYTFIRDLVAGGGNVLFVGTKKQAAEPIEAYAKRCSMPYVNERWLGGMLTNFRTIKGRVDKMLEFEAMRDAGDFDAMPKKEALMNTRELEKLQRYLTGIRHLQRQPDAVFVIDTKKEHIGVTEAKRLKIPVVAVVDSNCDPDSVDFVIPGNDDAIRSTTLMSRIIADAVLEGRFIGSKGGAVMSPEAERSPEEMVRAEMAAAPAAPAAPEAPAPAPEAAAPRLPPRTPPRRPSRRPNSHHPHTAGGPGRHERTHRSDGFVQREGRAGPAPADRRRDDGRQEGAHRDRRRHGGGQPAAPREGAGQGGRPHRP